MIPPINAALRVVDTDGDRSGVIGYEFHRWLQLIARAISSTYVGDQAYNASFVIKDGQFGIHGKRLVLSGSQRLTIEGTGRLVLCG